jgi:hypothetical protein
MKNKYWNILISVFLSVTLLCTLCNSQAKTSICNKSQEAFLALIKNACVTIYSWDNLPICFENGVHKEGSAYGNILEPIIIAHFNSDSSEYAIAPMSYCGGGSGLFYFILLFVHVHNHAVQLACADVLEDGTMDAVRIKGNIIMVDMKHADSTATAKYLFRGNNLVDLKKKE